jgi:hypothetical protein
MEFTRSQTYKEALSTIRNNLVMINTLTMATNKILEALESQSNDKN